MRNVITTFILLMGSLITLSAQRAGEVIAAPVTAEQTAGYFTMETLGEEVLQRMRGRSLPAGKEDWGRCELRYLRVLHHNAQGETQVGELVCNKLIAARLLSILRSLYDCGYRIERMVLIDEYGGDDSRSMKANNTSCFNYRTIQGTNRLSNHGRGLAIDINPLYNPWVRGNKVDPIEGRPYAFNRTKPMKAPVPIITTADQCYKLFISHGFTWGGAWRSSKDYQHFEFSPSAK